MHVLQLVYFDEKERREKATQTMSAWVKDVWVVPQNLLEAVGPHYQGEGLCPL
jgi:hypothetical protein